jgi:hypothetical protein
MVTTQEKASDRIKLQIINPYTTQKVRLGGNLKFERLDIANQDELDFVNDEALEKEEAAKQNAVLALIVTPRMFENNTPAPPIMVMAAYSHASFVTAFNMLSNEEKQNTRVLRSFWVGGTANMPKLRESSDIEAITSDLLVTSLAEKVRLYKANALTGRLIPFKPSLDESAYDGGVEYREHLERIKGKSKHELKIIKSLAEGKKPKVVTDCAFGFGTPIITEEEIQKVQDLVAKNPEPTLPYRPAALNQADRIANALKNVLQGEKNVS